MLTSMPPAPLPAPPPDGPSLYDEWPARTLAVATIFGSVALLLFCVVVYEARTAMTPRPAAEVVLVEADLVVMSRT